MCSQILNRCVHRQSKCFCKFRVSYENTITKIDYIGNFWKKSCNFEPSKCIVCNIFSIVQIFAGTISKQSIVRSSSISLQEEIGQTREIQKAFDLYIMRCILTSAFQYLYIKIFEQIFFPHLHLTFKHSLNLKSTPSNDLVCWRCAIFIVSSKPKNYQNIQN